MIAHFLDIRFLSWLALRESMINAPSGDIALFFPPTVCALAALCAGSQVRSLASHECSYSPAAGVASRYWRNGLHTRISMARSLGE
jgi:hypothetical protein